MLLLMAPLPFDMPAVLLLFLCIIFLWAVVCFLGVVVFMLVDEDIEPPAMLLFPLVIWAPAVPAKASVANAAIVILIIRLSPKRASLFVVMVVARRDDALTSRTTPAFLLR